MSANKVCIDTCIDTCIDRCPQPHTRGLTTMCLYFTKLKIIFFVHYKFTGHPRTFEVTIQY